MRTVRDTVRFRRDYRREKSGRLRRRLDADLLATDIGERRAIAAALFRSPARRRVERSQRFPYPTAPHPDLPEAGRCEPRARPAGLAQRAWRPRARTVHGRHARTAQRIAVLVLRDMYPHGRPPCRPSTFPARQLAKSCSRKVSPDSLLFFAPAA